MWLWSLIPFLAAGIILGVLFLFGRSLKYYQQEIIQQRLMTSKFLIVTSTLFPFAMNLGMAIDKSSAIQICEFIFGICGAGFSTLAVVLALLPGRSSDDFTMKIVNRKRIIVGVLLISLLLIIICSTVISFFY